MDVKLKEKRVKVLEKIDKLIKKCDCFYIEDQEKCRNCQDIRSLGNELLTLVDQRAIIDKNGMKTFVTELEVNAIENKFLEDFPITKLEYLEMRNVEKLKDSEIMLQIGTNKRDLDEFKSICGITEEKGKITDHKVNLKTMSTTQEFIDNFPITKSKYLEMKINKEMSDGEIMKEIGVPQRQLTNWKRLVGILGQMRAKKKIDKQDALEAKRARMEKKMKEYEEIKASTNLNDAQIAERIGISFSTLWNWKKKLKNK